MNFYFVVGIIAITNRHTRTVKYKHIWNTIIRQEYCKRLKNWLFLLIKYCIYWCESKLHFSMWQLSISLKLHLHSIAYWQIFVIQFSKNVVLQHHIARYIFLHKMGRILSVWRKYDRLILHNFMHIYKMFVPED